MNKSGKSSKSARIESIYSYYRTCYDNACAAYRSAGTLDATTEYDLMSYYDRLADKKAAAVR